MKPRYMTRTVTINRESLENLITRVASRTIFPDSPNAITATGEEVDAALCDTVAEVEDILFGREEDDDD